MKKTITAIIVIVLSLALFAACASGEKEETPPASSEVSDTPAVENSPASETRTFTDSTGRELSLPANIEKIAATGSLAQMIIFALAPEMLVGISSEWDDIEKEYIPKAYLNLPVLGHLYGTKGDLNLESLLAADPDIVIDIGESKGSIAEDLDSLTAQTGIPFVHISASLSTYSETYTMLGELLGLEDRAKTLSDYCDSTYARVVDIAEMVEKVSLLYIVGEKGLNVIAKDSYHSEMIDLLSNNLAVVDDPSSKGTGNEVDMEQILAWNPDCIIFENGSVYGSVAQDSVWKGLGAISEGRYYEAPEGPHNWMGFPPSVQRCLGLLWMIKLLYPDAANYDLFEEAQTYFELFYHTELTPAQFDALTANSLG